MVSAVPNCISCVLPKAASQAYDHKENRQKTTLKHRLYMTKLGNTKSFPCSWKNSCRIFNHTCPVAITVLILCSHSLVYNFHSLLGQSFPQMLLLFLMQIHTHCFTLLMAESKTEEEWKKKFLLLSFLLSIKPVVEIWNEFVDSHEHSYVAPEISHSYMLPAWNLRLSLTESRMEVPGSPSSPRDRLPE